MPGRSINSITGFTAEKGYYIVPKVSMDLSAIVSPPNDLGDPDIVPWLDELAAKQYAAIPAPYHTGNSRNDAIAITQLSGAIYLMAYTRFGAASGDADPATIYGAISTDECETWGAPFIIVPAIVGAQNIIPSFFDRSGTLVLVYYKYLGSAITLQEVTNASRDGVTWTAPVQRYVFPAYPSGAPDVIVRLTNGKLVFPTCVNTNGIPESIGGEYSGRLLVSNDDGLTWADSGLVIDADNLFVGEPQVVEVNRPVAGVNQDILYFFWRNNQGYTVPYVEITDLTTFSQASVSAMKQTGLPGINATVRIIYDKEQDTFFAGMNRITGVLAQTTTDTNDRLIMDLWAAYRDFNRWEMVMNIDQGANYHFFEPTLRIIRDHIISAYSDGISDDGFKHSIRTRRFPMAACLPRYTVGHYQNLQIRLRRDGWMQGGLDKALGLQMGLEKTGLHLGVWQMTNNPVVGHVAFLPYENIRVWNTDRGFVTDMKVPGTMNAGEALRTLNFLSNAGAIAASEVVLRIQNNGGTIFDFLADGKFRIYNAPEFADNAAAIAGGLAPKTIYKTGDFLKIVH